MKKISIIFALSLVALGSCKKSFLDTKPSTSQNIDEIFKSTKTAYKALNGLHTYMINPNGSASSFGHMSIALRNDFLGNDMPLYFSYNHFFYDYNYSNITSATGTTGYVWGYYYAMINNANLILDRVDSLPGLLSERSDLKAQSLAYRGFAYMNLIQYYQKKYVGNENLPGIPVYTKGTTIASEGKGRGIQKEVYTQIRNDLRQSLYIFMNGSPAKHTGDKSHINQSVVEGLLARYYLLTNQWDSAFLMAFRAVDPIMSAVENSKVDDGFNSNLNPEWIWASNQTEEQKVGSGLSNFIGWMDYESSGYGYPQNGTLELYNKIPASDVRKGWFENFGSKYGLVQKKFKASKKETVLADYCFMRGSEMLLIMAEAKAQSNQLGDAVLFLGKLLNARKNTTDISTMNKDALLDFIYWQRRIELWGEGHAFFDLKRSGQNLKRAMGDRNHYYPGLSSMTANDNRFVFKIPIDEITANPNIGPDDQNP